MEQLTPSKFADLIGVQRSSVSHVLSGRNNPSFDFLQKTLKAFPGLRADWLIQGIGGMYENIQQQPVADLFSSVEQKETAEPVVETDTEPSGAENAVFPPGATPAGSELRRETGSPKLAQVILIYDDQTFRSFKPSE